MSVSDVINLSGIVAVDETPKPKYTSGVLAKFARTVQPASQGVLTDLP